MTENRHPLEDQARALVDDNRFCEWLDAVDALRSGWPHSHYSARRWLEQQCEVASSGALGNRPGSRCVIRSNRPPLCGVGSQSGARAMSAKGLPACKRRPRATNADGWLS